MAALKRTAGGAASVQQGARRGRPATLTEDARQAQLRQGKAAHRARAAEAGKVRLDMTVSAETKAKIEAYRAEHNLPNLGAALDAMLSQ
ncbi:hypothetical protein [Burkholderia ambifaria]|uniref:hypothetical protein n=1 Tax=Burkholderia ambifaria TaxID=152480 RepID=UPI001589488F|nr:hypothetical protein [Burkholderia ambifaria]